MSDLDSDPDTLVERPVFIPECAIRPRNYHARRKTTTTQRAFSSQSPNTHATHQPSEATQSIPSSSSQRNHHARKKTTTTQRAFSSQSPNTHATHQSSEATQSIPSSSSQRNHHARKKTTVTQRAFSSQSPNTHATHQPSESTQSIPSSQQPATTTLATGTSAHTDNQAGWWIRFLRWIGGVSIQNTESRH